MFSRRDIQVYHRQTTNALSSGEAWYDARRRFRVLFAAYENHSDDPQFLELIVMSGLFIEARHYFVFRQLAKIREIRESQGRFDLYQKFEERLASNKLGVLINNHGYGTRNLSDAVDTNIFSAASDHVAQLAELGYRAAANSGTLLGLTRDKSLIPFDDDIDLFVILHTNSHQAAAKEFMTLAQTLHENGHDRAMTESSRGIIKLSIIEGFEVDLFPAYQIEKQFFIYPYGFENLTVNDILPLGKCPHSGLPIPRNPETTLQANYGKGWRVPDPRFTFPWQKQNRKFAALLRALTDLNS